MLNCSNVPNVVKNLCVLKDVEINREASEYFNDNYLKILDNAKKMSLGKKYDIMYQDVVNDVYLSIIKAEETGTGFNPALNLTVEQFVFGRIKRYMMNTKYRLGEYSKCDDITYTCISAYSSEELEHAYNNAKDINVENCYNELDGNLDIEEELKTCLRGAKKNKLNLMRLIEEPTYFLGKSKNNKNKAAKNVLSTLRNLLEPEALESLRVVLEYDNRSIIKDLMGKVLKEIEDEDKLIREIVGA